MSSWRTVLVTLVGIGWCVVGGIFLALGKQPGPAPLLLAAMIMIGFAIGHIKPQFADSRAHLLPHFRRVHATVAVSILLLLTVFMPGLIIWLTGLRSVGLLAVAVLVLGASVWSTLWNSRFIALSMLVAFAAMGTSSGAEAVTRFVSGQHESLAVALLVAGAVISAAGLIRMTLLNEDMPEYRQGVQPGRGLGGARTAQPVAGAMLPFGLGDWLVERHVANVTAHARRAPHSPWSQIGRWRLGAMMGPSLWLVGAALLVYWQIFGSFLSERAGFAFMTSVMLGPLVMFAAYNRPMLGYNSLLPVDRDDYLKQVTAASAVSHAETWAVVTGCAVLWASLDDAKPVDPARLATLAAISLLLQVWYFGIAAWLMPDRFRFASVAGFALAFGFSQPLLLVSDGPFPFARAIALSLAGVLAVAGVALTRAAHRSWLAADLD
jgi:hypothetical protein